LQRRTEGDIDDTDDAADEEDATDLPMEEAAD
jgi:hypothetical protein